MKKLKIIRNKLSCFSNLASIVFNLYELDKDIYKQERILTLANRCKEKFAISSWTYFRNEKENKTTTRPYVLLIRNILSEFNIKYYNKRTTILLNGNKIYTTKYYIHL